MKVTITYSELACLYAFTELTPQKEVLGLGRSLCVCVNATTATQQQDNS